MNYLDFIEQLQPYLKRSLLCKYFAQLLEILLQCLAEFFLNYIGPGLIFVLLVESCKRSIFFWLKIRIAGDHNAPFAQWLGEVVLFCAVVDLIEYIKLNVVHIMFLSQFNDHWNAVSILSL